MKRVNYLSRAGVSVLHSLPLYIFPIPDYVLMLICCFFLSPTLCYPQPRIIRKRTKWKCLSAAAGVTMAAGKRRRQKCPRERENLRVYYVPASKCLIQGAGRTVEENRAKVPKSLFDSPPASKTPGFFLNVFFSWWSGDIPRRASLLRL